MLRQAWTYLPLYRLRRLTLVLSEYKNTFSIPRFIISAIHAVIFHTLSRRLIRSET